MSETRLQIVIDAQNNAQKALSQLSRDMKDVGNRFSTESKIIGSALKGMTIGIAAAGAGFAAFGVSSFNAFRDSQVSMARFNATLATTGKAGEKARDQILAAADAAVKLGFDDEDAAEGMAKFFQRTKDVNQAMKLNQTAMDLARAKNIGLADATKMVNLVLSGNGKALKEYGIILKEGTSPLKALAELQTQVAGQSKAFSETVEGSMQVLGKTFGNLKESVGGALSKAIQPALESLAKFAQTKEAQDAIASFSSFIETKFSAAVGNITAKVKEWYQSVGGADGIKAKLTDLWNKITTEVIPAIQQMISVISSITGFLYEHRKAILLGVAAWEAYKVAIAMVSTASAIARLAVLSIPTSIVIVVGIASIIAAIKASVELRKALKDASSEADKAISKVSELVKKASALEKNDPKRKKLLEQAQKSYSSQADIQSSLADSLSFSSLFGFRATGGPVMSGKPYMVGENGPEMFIPSTSGTIQKSVDNSRRVEIVNNWDFSGAYIGDKESFMREIEDRFGRKQELARMGAI